jgi:hypothetical protein
MIRILAHCRGTDRTDGDPEWLAIEGDATHGYLVRAFADLSSKQLYDHWTRDREAAFEYAEAYGIGSSDWEPRSKQLPGSLPFPDLDTWTPDNSEFERRPTQL